MKILRMGIALTSILVMQTNTFSQTLENSVLKDVIVINNEDVTANRSGFLIDIPIQCTNLKLTILNNSNIPNTLFFDGLTFMPKQKEILLISPDKEYYKAVAMQRNVDSAEPVATNKYYYIKRSTGSFTVDSVTVRGKQPDPKEKMIPIIPFLILPFPKN